jgi:hypothetical protein
MASKVKRIRLREGSVTYYDVEMGEMEKMPCALDLAR